MENKELELAWQLVQHTGNNVFLTGKAGTGKTTFLHALKSKTHKRTVVLAPTGIAAINAGGSTLHSFFQLPFGPYIPASRDDSRYFRFSKRKINIIRSIDLVIIDEISMVRADLLDSVDAVLRRYRDRTRPFGGVQLLMIGDLQQLAPVAKPEEWEMLRPYYDTQYFFSSIALREAGFVTVELHTVYRQTDLTFIELLNAVRNNTADSNVLARLNERYVPDFEPDDDEGYVRLTTHNFQADRINEENMERLDTPPRVFRAIVKGEFPELSFPTFEQLTLKVGAQVMFVKNDSSGHRRYFNGMLGRVVEMSDSTVSVVPQDAEEAICVGIEEWTNTRYTLNDSSKEIEEEVLGTFQQIPLKAAWAITVHKSQGLTFSHAIIDVQRSFTHGQTYVALSRCKSLEGMVLSAPIPAAAIITDPCIIAFTDSIPAQTPTLSKVRDMEREYFLRLLSELFDFTPLRHTFDAYLRIVDEYLYKQFPRELAAIKAARQEFGDAVYKVAQNFSVQYVGIVTADYDYAENALLQERCHKGATYFLDKIADMAATLHKNRVESGNKSIAERLSRTTSELDVQIRVKRKLLSYFAERTFSVSAYLRQRAMTSIEDEDAPRAKGRKSAVKPRKKMLKKAYEVESEMAEDANSYSLHELEEYPDMPDLTAAELPY